MLSQLCFRRAFGEGVQPAVFDGFNFHWERFFPCFHRSDTAVDRLAQAMEFGLIVRHNPHRAVFMKIPGDIRQTEPELRQLLHREFEKGAVIRFEMNLSALLQNLAV